MSAVHDCVQFTLEAVNARALQEERSLLGEERFERGRLSTDGSDFDLAEVRIHGRVEREIRCESVLEVCAGGELLIARISRDRVRVTRSS